MPQLAADPLLCPHELTSVRHMLERLGNNRNKEQSLSGQFPTPFLLLAIYSRFPQGPQGPQVCNGFIVALCSQANREL